MKRRSGNLFEFSWCGCRSFVFFPNSKQDETGMEEGVLPQFVVADPSWCEGGDELEWDGSGDELESVRGCEGGDELEWDGDEGECKEEQKETLLVFLPSLPSILLQLQCSYKGRSPGEIVKNSETNEKVKNPNASVVGLVLQRSHIVRES
ncbi:hypothetical protein LXL04_012874 [Taraxacum kok-saghyz]